jgi:thiamine-monophosphate kinase
MGELDLVDWITRNTRTGAGSKVRIGPGDDAAVLAGTGADEIVFTIDEVVEGTHFRFKGSGLGPAARGRDVGYKAHASATSDLAAMGAEPLGVVAAVALRRGQAGKLGRTIHRGLVESARATGCPLVGGNVTETSGPVILTVAAIGRAPKGGAFLRSGARVGDAIYVTGELGGSILGRHLRPVPRFKEARLLRRAGGVGGVIDISDGLALDLFRVARASEVGAVIDAGRVPVSRAAKLLAKRTGRTPLDHALGDGEDYELLFTLDGPAARRLEAVWNLGTRLTRIGEVLPRKRGLLIREGDRVGPLEARGYTHL